MNMQGYTNLIQFLTLSSVCVLCCSFPPNKHHQQLFQDEDINTLLESYQTKSELKINVNVRDDVDPEVCNGAKQAKVRRSSNSTACNICLMHLPITMSCPLGTFADVNGYSCVAVSEENVNLTPWNMINKKLDTRVSNQIIEDICATDHERDVTCQEFKSCRARSRSSKYCMRTLRHHIVKRQIKFLIPDNSDYASF